jgi:ATP-dependent RNA helicase DDX54/DBP10
VKIEGGQLKFGDMAVELPFIKGTGIFDVMYLDERLRIFKSGNSFAVQVKRSFLDDVIAG